MKRILREGNWKTNIKRASDIPRPIISPPPVPKPKTIIQIEIKRTK